MRTGGRVAYLQRAAGAGKTHTAVKMASDRHGASGMVAGWDKCPS